MARVLELILRPRRQLVRGSIPVSRTDERVLELQAAMEILAEVFGTDVSEIDMMLKHRYVEAGEWPREFFLAE